jgi:hypothetical protein
VLLLCLRATKKAKALVILSLVQAERIGELVANATGLAVVIRVKMFAIRTRLPVMICIPGLISLAVPVFVTLSISGSVRVAASGVVRLRCRRWRCCLRLRRLRRGTSGN